MITANEARELVENKYSEIAESMDGIIRSAAMTGKNSVAIKNTNFNAKFIAEKLKKYGFQITDTKGSAAIFPNDDIIVHW